jgi:hypothetical protein
MPGFKSVNLVVCTDRFKENRLGPLILNKAENDSEIVPRAACPGALKLTLYL